jgi:hypothetical protein
MLVSRRTLIVSVSPRRAAVFGPIQYKTNTVVYVLAAKSGWRRGRARGIVTRMGRHA